MKRVAWSLTLMATSALALPFRMMNVMQNDAASGNYDIDLPIMAWSRSGLRSRRRR